MRYYKNTVLLLQKPAVFWHPRMRCPPELLSMLHRHYDSYPAEVSGFLAADLAAVWFAHLFLFAPF